MKQIYLGMVYLLISKEKNKKNSISFNSYFYNPYLSSTYRGIWHRSFT
ncbi:hypothetical protein [Sphingobacterium sp. UBA6320]|nr:hypothetical protein [Sphingobacterium sp. UBA6320]